MTASSLCVRCLSRSAHPPVRALRVFASAVYVLALIARPSVVVAQTSVAVAPSTRVSVTVAPVWQSWSFAKRIPLDSIRVGGVTQISAPFSVFAPLGARWSATVDGAVASSTLDATSGSGKVTRSFTGLTDLRVRATGQLIGDALRVTFGVNVPTGTSDLSPVQNDVIRVTAAPALNAHVPIYGTGFGATAGLVYARFIGAWAWALGASVEKRGQYAPLDAQIAGADARTELDPGGALHFSLGGDGLVGGNRLLLGVVSDFYGEDQLRRALAGGASITQRFQLGPTISIGAALEIKSERFRDLTLRVNERYRAGFTDSSGTSVSGSSGNYLDIGMSGLRGAPNRPSLLLGVNARHHTGLPIDKGLIGAGLTAAAVTVGAVIPTAGLTYTAHAELSMGSVKTQLVTSGMTSLTLGLTVRRQ